jgi:hypothetical protein
MSLFIVNVLNDCSGSLVDRVTVFVQACLDNDSYDLGFALG